MENGSIVENVTLRRYLSYIFWGVLTTLVNVASFFVLRKIALAPIVAANLSAWVLSVLFAFYTNRRFVFHSPARGPVLVSRELARFFASRIFSGALDMALMYALAVMLMIEELPVKVAVNVIVIVVNYLTSLAFVFRKGEEK